MKGHFLDEVAERHDNLPLPPKVLREEQAAYEAETQRWVQVASEDYASTETRFINEVEFGVRVTQEGREALAEEVLAPLRSGELSAKDAAKRVAAMRADLHEAREALRQAMESEGTKWSEVGEASAAAYQRQLAKRAPQLFAGGRGLLALPIYDD
jgi:hypothetical protein